MAAKRRKSETKQNESPELSKETSDEKGGDNSHGVSDKDIQTAKSGPSGANRAVSADGLSAAARALDISAAAKALDISAAKALDTSAARALGIGSFSAFAKALDTSAARALGIGSFSTFAKTLDIGGLSAVAKLSDIMDLSRAAKLQGISDFNNQPLLKFDLLSGSQKKNTVNSRAESVIGARQNYIHGATDSLKNEIDQLKKDLELKAEELFKALQERDFKDEQFLKMIEDTKAKEEALDKKSLVQHILPRIRESAQEKILKSDFSAEFVNGADIDCVVISIDIRRSTELMLKARTPQKYAEFIIALSHRLKEVILENYGIFDKFTGDGILAFFPSFFSGDDAMFYALRAADSCHKVFQEVYSQRRGTFNVIIKDIGLGIGIDYGKVSLVNSSSDLTVVGIPVVYACRMSSAPAGTTYLNQPAFEKVILQYDKHTKFWESQIEIKNEGIAIAYQVEINENSFGDLKLPAWETEAVSESDS